eukprot:2693292-Amphidinium_carterae.1
MSRTQLDIEVLENSLRAAIGPTLGHHPQQMWLDRGIMSSWRHTRRMGLHSDVIRWSRTHRKVRLKMLEPKFTYSLMDLSLPTLGQTRSKLEDLLWKGIVEHMPYRPRNQPSTCSRLLKTIARVSKTCGPAASVALMRALLNVGSNSRHSHPNHCCACTTFHCMGGVRHSFMQLCFKPFLTAVPRYSWLQNCNGAALIQQLLTSPIDESDIRKLSNLAGIALTAHHMCKHGETCEQRHCIVLACRRWHSRH